MITNITDRERTQAAVIQALESARDEMAKRIEAQQWQPIETAPKGGCLVDILMPGGRRWAGCHYDAICDQWRNIGPSGHMVTVRADYPTHWMPLPPPPTDKPIWDQLADIGASDPQAWDKP